MKILLLNGSPHKKGSTNAALTLLTKFLQEYGLSSEIVHIGANTVPCLGCYKCMPGRKCIIDDSVNKLLSEADSYDAIVVGAPVYFASPAGGVVSFLDRLFESGYEKFRYKPAASFTVARRSGTAASNDVLNKYFMFSNMPIISTNYINNIFARKPEDVYKDEEGIELLRDLAENMSWMLCNLHSSSNQKVSIPSFKTKYYLRHLTQ